MWSLSVFVKGSDSSDFKGLCSDTKLVTEYQKKYQMFFNSEIQKESTALCFWHELHMIFSNFSIIYLTGAFGKQTRQCSFRLVNVCFNF